MAQQTTPDDCERAPAGCWDMDVRVIRASSFRRRHAGGLWLRASITREQRQQEQARAADPLAVQEEVVLEAKIADAESSVVASRGEQRRVTIPHAAVRRASRGKGEQGSALSALVLELWAAEDAPDDGCSDGGGVFLSFVGCARVDLNAWRVAPAERSTRWYGVQRARFAANEAWEVASGYEEHEERVDPEQTYFKATLTEHHREEKTKTKTKHTTAVPEAPPVQSAGVRGFQFALPSQTVTRNRRFLTTRVGEIVNEGNTELLRELLPVVLYGKAPLRSGNSKPSPSRQHEWSSLNKALQLLQLSCQYACYCTSTLDDNTRKIEAKQTSLVQRTAQLQTHRQNLEQRRRNLRRELQVLDSSLDGMRMLLGQVDPSCLEQLEEDCALV